MGLMFRKQDRARVTAGEITVTFRLWTRAKVKAGSSYPSSIGTIVVEDVQVLPAAMVSADDVGPSGLAGVQAIWESAGEHTKTVVTPETLLHRVQFRCVPDTGDDQSARTRVEPPPPAVAKRRRRTSQR